MQLTTQEEKPIAAAHAQPYYWLMAVALYKDRRLVARFNTDGLTLAEFEAVGDWKAHRLVNSCLKVCRLEEGQQVNEVEAQIDYQVAVHAELQVGINEADRWNLLAAALSDSTERIGNSEVAYQRSLAAIRIDIKTRQLHKHLELCGQLIPKLGELPTPPYDDWLSTLQGRLVKTARAFGEVLFSRKDRTWREVVGDVAKELRASLDQNLQQIPGRLSWGMVDADKYLHPIRDGEMVIIGARPSVGKSSLVVGLARYNAKKGKRFLLFTFEDSPEQIALRMNAQEARIPSATIFSMPKEMQERFMASFQVIRDLRVEVINAVGMNIEQVAAKAELIHSLDPVDGVGIDYLQLVSPVDRRMPREQQVAETSRGAKILAGRIQRPVIVLSQLNRDGERDNRPPRLSDLRESGAIEQDGDRVVLLHRPSKNAAGENQDVQSGDCPNTLEIWMVQAKMRNGPTSTVRVAFESEIVNFNNLTP